MVEAREKLEPAMDSSTGTSAGFSSVPGIEDPILGTMEKSLLESRKGCVQPWPDFPWYVYFNVIQEINQTDFWVLIFCEYISGMEGAGPSD